MGNNTQLDLAYAFVATTGENVFLTGRAGTGKTTFLERLRKSTPKRMVVVAPTGVAAINAAGTTIHSFFQLPLGIFVPGTSRRGEEVRRFSKSKIAVIKSMDLLVIDEISMVRADTLDNIDDTLRRFRDRSKPFGGVQLLMIGDVQQLAPVTRDDEWEILKQHYASPYFFDSQALGQTSYTSIELKHIYRQNDGEFIELLSRVRENRVDDNTLALLNRRHKPDFAPPESEGYITLTSHNSTARSINEERLAALPTEEYHYRANVEGEFPEYLYPTDAGLRLRKGAQVMFTKNDPSSEKRFVNGTIGEITGIDRERIEVRPVAGGETIAVEQTEWNNTKYSLDTNTGTIVEQVEGVFRQYPLRTAWAITIHKSQGLTFDRAIIDAAEAFSHGQVYVALSRCRSLEGMVLRTPLRKEAIINDREVDGFLRYVEQNQPNEHTLALRQRDYRRTLLLELFDFGDLNRRCRAMAAYMREAVRRLYPILTERWEQTAEQLRTEVEDVGAKFRGQIGRLMSEGGHDDKNATAEEALAERVRKGAEYFLGKCQPAAILTVETAVVTIDNKEVRKRVTEMLAGVNREMNIKLGTLNAALEGFTVQSHLEAKGMAIAASEASAGSAKNKKKTAAGKPDNKEDSNRDTETDGDIRNIELFETLRKWRYETATEQGVPAYVVATQKVLVGIARAMPSNAFGLAAIKGIGPKTIEKYGEQMLEIVARYRNDRK